jgi:hypothetical protein
MAVVRRKMNARNIGESEALSKCSFAAHCFFAAFVESVPMPGGGFTWDAADVSRKMHGDARSSRRIARLLDELLRAGLIARDGDAGMVIDVMRWVGIYTDRPPIPTSIRLAVFKRDGGKCRSCDATEQLEFDHVLAWSKGGRSTIENLQLLCRSCNAAKGAR